MSVEKTGVRIENVKMSKLKYFFSVDNPKKLNLPSKTEK